MDSSFLPPLHSSSSVADDTHSLPDVNCRIAPIRCYRKMGAGRLVGSISRMANKNCWQQRGIATKRFPKSTTAVTLANSPRWPTITASTVSGCWLNPRAASRGSVPGKHQTVWPCSVQRVQFPGYPYPSTCWIVQRLTSKLGQFPLAHSLRPFLSDVLPAAARSGSAVGRGNGPRPATGRSLSD